MLLPTPAEDLRVAALRRLGVLDMIGDSGLDDFVALVARVFEVPCALVSFIDEDHQWFESTVGVASTGTARDIAFCDHTIRQRGVLVVEDATKDRRFAENPMVTGEPHIRFYAGAPLVTVDGHAVGSLCVFDTRVRTVSPYQEAMILILAEQVTTQMERTAGRAGSDTSATGTAHSSWIGARAADPAELRQLERLVKDGSVGYVATSQDGLIEDVNAAAARMFGYTESELIGSSARELAHPDLAAQVESAIADTKAGRRSFYESIRVYRHRTGRKIQVRCTVSSWAADDGRGPRVVALIEDLTSRLAADTSRFAAERARQAVLDTATDAFISMDESGRVLDWNASAEQLFGYSAGEAIDRELTALIVPAHLAEDHRRGVARVVGGGAPSLIGQSIELPARHKEGIELQIELTVWSTPSESGGLQFHAFCRDIGERVASRTALTEANRQLAEGREQLEAAFEASPTADAIIDSTGCLVEVNPAICRFLDGDPEALVGRTWRSLFHEPDIAPVEAVLAQVLATGHAVTRTEVRCVTTAGRVVWGLMSLLAMAGETDRGRVMLRIEDIQDHKDLQSALVRQVSHDAVSGLPNRSLFVERVREALASRPSPTPVTIVVLLVDGLSMVIDRDGYAASDRLLALVAERLVDGLGEEVTLAHLQPGEFGAVVPGGRLDAVRLSEQLLDALRAPVALPSGLVSLRGSIGISAANPSAQEPTSQIGRVIQDAESAAQQARAEGSNCIAFAAPEMRRAQQQQDRMEALIRDALDNDEIKVAYQPVWDLSTDLLVGAEALLRVSDPAGRPLPPLDVVPAAETSGLIIEIGRRVLQIAARQAARWRTDHGVLLPVAVNVSAVQLGHPGFPEDVFAAVESAGLPPEALSLELTESVLLKTGSVGMGQLRDLREAGIQLAIDDFGTGYASLSYLRDLPASTLKIDRSFVEGIPHDHGAVAIVAGVIGLAKNFGMTCVAEGIETEAQRAYLAERGVSGQGYLLGRPGDGSAVGRILARGGASESVLRPDQRDPVEEVLERLLELDR